MVLLAALAGVYFILTTLLPVRPLTTPITALLARVALALLGYYNISAEVVQDKRSKSAVAQAMRSVQTGDVIIANWGGYVDVLYYAFR
jgi:hypothetical protein